jgi:hypothetical protein
MPDKNLDAVSGSLDDALQKMQRLEERIRNGEDVPEEELTAIAKQIAFRMEDALDAMKELIGPEESAEVEKEMIAGMSDEEFTEWSQMYPMREIMRMERKQEKLANTNG